MDAVENYDSSIFDLITKLAISLSRDEHGQLLATAVPQRRIRIFEAVLGSSTVEQPTSFVAELQRQICACQQSSMRQKSLRARLEKLRQFKKLLKSDATSQIFLETALGNGLAYLLLHVSELDVPPITTSQLDSVGQPEHKLLTPAPLQLQLLPPSANKRLAAVTGPKFFNSIDFMHSQLLSVALHPRQPSPLLLGDISALMEQKPKHSDSFKESVSRIAESLNRMPRVTPRLPLLPSAHSTTASDKSSPNLTETVPSKYFVSDLKISHELKRRIDQAERTANSQSQSQNLISLPDLIEDLKRAAAGLQSETFACDASGAFALQAETTLRTVLPEVLAGFVQPFLDCGNCYLRLSARSRWTADAQQLERPLNRTMRQAVNEFLATYRQLLLAKSATRLTQLYTSARSSLQLIIELDHMFTAEPRLNIARGTSGPYLLGYLWSSIDACINSEYSELLLHLLQCICETYYNQLQRWIYHGVLEEPPFNELFIARSSSDQHWDECSKEFFDKTYVVHAEALPGFLIGCEQAILQCGKYNRLLKAYKRKHALFEQQPPEMVVCLSEQQLVQLRRRLEHHYDDAKVRHLFEPCTMQQIYDKRAAERSLRKVCMRERTQAHLGDWAERHRAFQLETQARKRRQHEELSAQLEEQQQRRLEQRQLDIVEELKFRNECEQLEEQRLQRHRAELRRRVVNLQDAIAQSPNDELNKETEASTPDQSSSSSRSFASCCDELPVELEPTKELAQKQTTSTSMSLGVQLKRSASDVLNSNEQSAQSDASLTRNCTRMLASETRVQLQDTQRNSEAEENRRRVLNRTEMVDLPDVNLNTMQPQPAERTELQRNRARMMEHDKFSAFNGAEDSHAARSRCQIDADTQLARNRRRVLDGEFNIKMTKRPADALHLPLETELKCAPVEAVGSPMSITSDIEEAADNSVNESQDTANANNNGIGVDNEHESEPVAPHPPTVTIYTAPRLATWLPLKSVVSESETDFTFSRPAAHNPFMIRRYLQLSVMLPLNAHFALLRNEVLRILLQDLCLYEHLRRLRNHFFLLDGAFGTLLTSGILGHIEAGMEPRSLCQKGILDAILNNALGASGSDYSTATVAENLTLNCTRIPEHFDIWSLEAVEPFALHYKVTWPLNLVISDETVTKYGQIFSYLLKLRHVGFVLERAYEQLQVAAKCHGAPLRLSQQYRHLQMVRHKLSHFVTTLQHHLAANALQVSWRTFKEAMRHVNSVEGLYQQHVAYIKRIAFLALLNRRSAKLQETIDGAFVIVLRFCKILQSQTFVVEEEQFIHPRYKRLVHEETEFDKFVRYIIYLGNKVVASGYQEEIGDLIRIINFNNYYKVI